MQVRSRRGACAWGWLSQGGKVRTLCNLPGGIACPSEAHGPAAQLSAAPSLLAGGPGVAGGREPHVRAHEEADLGHDHLEDWRACCAAHRPHARLGIGVGYAHGPEQAACPDPSLRPLCGCALRFPARRGSGSACMQGGSGRGRCPLWRVSCRHTCPSCSRCWPAWAWAASLNAEGFAWGAVPGTTGCTKIKGRAALHA